MALKYLYQANFADGSFFQQPIEEENDKSAIDPTKSAFFDVLQRQDELVSFGLFSEEVPDTWAVDLRDGHFEVNGLPFTAQNPSQPSKSDVTRRLIYFRKVTRNFNPGDLTEIRVHIAFHFGYQYNDKDGKNHQITIAVD